MAINLLCVILGGRICTDIKETKVGVKFSVAINKRDKDKNDIVKYFNIVAFGKTAEVCKKYLSKGSSIVIRGELDSYSFDDQNGKKVFITQVIASEIQILTYKTDQDKQNTKPDDFIEVPPPF